jgi:hypothetical protein
MNLFDNEISNDTGLLQLLKQPHDDINNYVLLFDSHLCTYNTGTLIFYVHLICLMEKVGSHNYLTLSCCIDIVIYIKQFCILFSQSF